MSQTRYAPGLPAHNELVKRAEIEPGLLRLFRWFVAIRLGLLLFLLVAGQDRAEGDPLFVPEPGIVILALLLLYLFTTPLQARLGRWYLPIALWIATIGPIVEQAITVNARLDDGASPNAALADYWLLFFYLFVPLILVAWQYRYRWVVFFTLGTFFLEAALTMGPLEATGADLGLLGALMVGRATLFAFVGLIIVKLVKALRVQREALATSVIARERLTMSEERRRLARELHDTLAHTLSGIAVQLEGATSLWDDDPEKSREMLGRSLESARSGLTEARRSISALRASPLENGGLTPALEELSRSVTETSDVAVTLESNGNGLLDEDVEHAAYRIAREAVTNVVRHSRAATAQIRLDEEPERLVLTVKDDGEGFDPGAVEDPDRHGIRGMRERAELIGASLDIRSSEGTGTVVEMTLERPT